MFHRKKVSTDDILSGRYNPKKYLPKEPDKNTGICILDRIILYVAVITILFLISSFFFPNSIKDSHFFSFTCLFLGGASILPMVYWSEDKDDFMLAVRYLFVAMILSAIFVYQSRFGKLNWLFEWILLYGF